EAMLAENARPGTAGPPSTAWTRPDLGHGLRRHPPWMAPSPQPTHRQSGTVGGRYRGQRVARVRLRPSVAGTAAVLAAVPVTPTLPGRDSGTVPTSNAMTSVSAASLPWFLAILRY